MMRPPIGVAILGFFALVNGVAVAIIGLQLMGAVASGPHRPAAACSSGGCWRSVSASVHRTRLRRVDGPAGRGRSGVLAVLGIFQAVMVLIATNNLGYGIAAALLPAVMVWYFNTDAIKDAFVKSEQGRGR